MPTYPQGWEDPPNCYPGQPGRTPLEDPRVQEALQAKILPGMDSDLPAKEGLPLNYLGSPGRCYPPKDPEREVHCPGSLEGQH